MNSEMDRDSVRFQSDKRRNCIGKSNKCHDADVSNRSNGNNEKKELLCMYACEIRLPAGRYLSETDGSIFVINASQPKVEDYITSDNEENEVECSANTASLSADLLSSKSSVFAAFMNDCKNQNQKEKENGFDPRSLLIDAFPSADIFKDFTLPNNSKGVLR